MTHPTPVRSRQSLILIKAKRAAALRAKCEDIIDMTLASVCERLFKAIEKWS